MLVSALGGGPRQPRRSRRTPKRDVLHRNSLLLLARTRTALTKRPILFCRKSSRTRSCYTRPTSDHACNNTSSRSSIPTSRGRAPVNLASSSPSCPSRTLARAWSSRATVKPSSSRAIAPLSSSLSRARSSMGSSTTSPEYVYHNALLMWLLTPSLPHRWVSLQRLALLIVSSLSRRVPSCLKCRVAFSFFPLIPANFHSSSILISNLTPHRIHHPIHPRIR